ncbi:winged helix-turn-helix transcriptional regulator [Gallibacterium anatis]|uniref:Winged helix-turn-helix transcriptional regulator n=1 Tax=Gallibacterium anatis TaxID=750 RepID=A0A921L0D4_9PAST|nr:winged helix-turn-helix transcriptional regulator [Gallibacterium anatis]
MKSVTNHFQKQLCNDGIVFRKDYQTNPPKVEYGLTTLDKELLQVLKSMEQFGIYYKFVTDKLE